MSTELAVAAQTCLSGTGIYGIILWGEKTPTIALITCQLFDT